MAVIDLPTCASEATRSRSLDFWSNNVRWINESNARGCKRSSSSIAGSISSPKMLTSCRFCCVTASCSAMGVISSPFTSATDVPAPPGNKVSSPKAAKDSTISPMMIFAAVLCAPSRMD